MKIGVTVYFFLDTRNYKERKIENFFFHHRSITQTVVESVVFLLFYKLLYCSHNSLYSSKQIEEKSSNKKVTFFVSSPLFGYSYRR